MHSILLQTVVTISQVLCGALDLNVVLELRKEKEHLQQAKRGTHKRCPIRGYNSVSYQHTKKRPLNPPKYNNMSYIAFKA